MSSIRLSRKIQAIQPSPTMALDTKAKQLAAEGRSIVNWTAGEPDYDTPKHISDAGVEAIRQGETHYTPAAGTPALKAAICRKLERENGLIYEPEQIIVSLGAKHSLYNAFMALLDPGDEVLMPAPYWVSYPEQIRISEGVPVVVPSDDSTGFKVTVDMLEEKRTERTKVLLINSPSNPSGAVYTPKELEAIGEFALKHGITIISDEIYEHLVYDGVEQVSIASLSPELYDITLVINGLSKAYAMTGWRIGYTAGPAPVIAAMSALQSHSTSNPVSIAQAASVVALDEVEASNAAIARMRDSFAERRNVMVAGLRKLPGFRCEMPAGAFYAFPNVAGLFGRTLGGRRVRNVDTLCEIFLEEVGVAMVPGSGFGSPENVRVSYATSMDLIEEGLQRLQRFLNESLQ